MTTGGQSVRFQGRSRSTHRLKRSRSQYMSTPHLNTSQYQLNRSNWQLNRSSWKLNHLNPDMKKSQNSVYINMQPPKRQMSKNRHIASAHKLIDGLNEEEISFKSRLRTILNTYNFQIAMVVLVIMDCIMVLGEMIIELQVLNKECTLGEHEGEHGEVSSHGEAHGGHEYSPSTESTWITTTVSSLDGDLHGSASSEHSYFSTCRHLHLLHELEEYFHLTSIFILFLFNVELLVRLYAFGYKYFLHLELILDALIVIISFWLDVAFLDSRLKKYLYLLIILRLWRVLRIMHAIMTAIKAPFERQIEKLKKKRKILQRDLAKAYFYSNMLEDEIKNLRRYIEEMEMQRQIEQAEEEEDDDEEDDDTQQSGNETSSQSGKESDQNNNPKEEKKQV